MPRRHQRGGIVGQRDKLQHNKMKKQLTIYYTSDVHGYFSPIDYASGNEIPSGLANCISNFEKDGKVYHLPDKSLQSRMAYKSGLQHPGKEIKFKLQRPEGKSLFDEPIVYHKRFRERCSSCGSRLICNGCSDCGMCDRRRA